MSAFIFTITSYIAGVKDRFTKDEKGATMVEYGIMVAFIALLVLAAVTLLGPQIANLFTRVDAAI
ncbi:Flp family type IVb pilin [Arthrobacter sp. AK01]|uniref:Flp family type IVb pilin n=1 Tax=Micrococcaceae TaxID=1268 RepID=UPI001E334C20|nr:MULTISPECIES: Flp family type IVb pilin [Micrococcaceae]MCD4850342.1 Flp family type IVb pilin [Arthrobacter sp. AK01]MCP1414932.1 pilus assembly protein Flp/PilA [Paenarthrobacter sp. A20]MCT9869407.1 Flp family type IVb pilin [Paenarthrobacter aurescens]